MGRAKLKMELIRNEKSRNATFAKRKKGLQKKLHELCTLCDVKACMVVYGPRQGDSSTEPDIWPEPDKVHEIINKYQLVDIDDRRKRTTTLSKFFEDQNKKIEEDFGKLRRKNDEMEYVTWDSKMDELSEDQLGQVFNTLESRIKDVNARIEGIKDMQSIAETGGIEFPPAQMNQFPCCYTSNPYQLHGVYGNSNCTDAIQTEPISFANPFRIIPTGYPSGPGTIFCQQSDPMAYYGGGLMNRMNNYYIQAIEDQMRYSKDMEFNRQVRELEFRNMREEELKNEEASTFSSSLTGRLMPLNFASFMPRTSNQMNFHLDS